MQLCFHGNLSLSIQDCNTASKLIYLFIYSYGIGISNKGREICRGWSHRCPGIDTAVFVSPNMQRQRCATVPRSGCLNRWYSRATRWNSTEARCSLARERLHFLIFFFIVVVVACCLLNSLSCSVKPASPAPSCILIALCCLLKTKFSVVSCFGAISDNLYVL